MKSSALGWTLLRYAPYQLGALGQMASLSLLPIYQREMMVTASESWCRSEECRKILSIMLHTSRSENDISLPPPSKLVLILFLKTYREPYTEFVEIFFFIQV